jgi:hypothetical protein
MEAQAKSGLSLHGGEEQTNRRQSNVASRVDGFRSAQTIYCGSGVGGCAHSFFLLLLQHLSTLLISDNSISAGGITENFDFVTLLGCLPECCVLLIHIFSSGCSELNCW